MAKEKLQSRLTKVNSRKEDGRKTSSGSDAPSMKGKQLFGTGMNYRVVINVFVWMYRCLIRRL
ncbi:MAG TPA: hypothetical protein DIS73_04490 [Planctomycetia bacterium]|nr:hypothetical protein [Planctomycetia bacterium]